MGKKRALRKFVFQEILSSRARFISITLLILIGVSFFTGLNASGPDMLKTASSFFEEQKLMDIHVVSTMGLEDEDLEILKQQPDLAILEAGYSKDVITEKDNKLLKIFSYNPANTLNLFAVKDGRLPEKSGEIALVSSVGIKAIYQIGDTVTFIPEGKDSDLSKQFDRTSYTVVGFVSSPLYVSEKQMGSTSLGKGTLDGYAIILDNDFNLSVYTDAYMTFQSLKGSNPYSVAYKDTINEYQKVIEDSFEQRAATRLADIKVEAEQELADAKTQVADGKQELANAKKELKDARTEIKEGKQKLQDAEDELVTAKAELLEGQRQYTVNKAKYDKQMADAKKQLKSGEVQLENEQKTLTQNGEKLKQGKQTVEAALKQLKDQESALTAQKSQLLALLAQTNQIIAIPIPYVTEEQRASLIQAGSTVSLADGQTLGDLWTSYFKGETTGASLVDAINGVLLQIESGLKTIDNSKDQLLTKKKELESQQKQLDKGQSELNKAAKKISFQKQSYEIGKVEGSKQLASAKAKLDAGWKSYNEGRKTLDKQKKELTKAEQTYKEGLAKYTGKKADAKADIADAETKIADGETELAELSQPDYYALSREDNTGYSEYADNANRLAALSLAFPAFFFAIAALVSLTTITRMIEEQRGQIGTLKAQGYTNWEISLKYYVYALGASVLGTALGLFTGFYGIPRIVINAYSSLYDFPNIVLAPSLSFGLLAFAIAVFCTGITAWLVLRQDLKSSPAKLMRPKAPKTGKRIFLERITPVWNRLNFNQKVTMRNLFRYKQRMLMTVFGIAGCMGLMMTGFGLNDSISDLSALQYQTIIRYQALVVFDEEAKKKDLTEAKEAVAEAKGIEDSLLVREASFEVKKSGMNTQQALMIVPKETKQISQFVTLRDHKSGEAIAIPKEGAVITEKLAELLQVKKSGSITLTDADSQEFTVPVAAIAENYTGHYIYMSPQTYETYFGVPAINYNAALLKYSPKDKVWEEKLSDSLNQYSGILAISLNSSMIGMFEEAMGSLNTVVIVLIVSAAILAFVVLYNLTNINVSERIRELSTIKVLGFYNQEVTMYIYRENLILSLFGIILGSFLGKFLHSFVLTTASMDNMMFSHILHVHSYIFAGLLTLLFSSMVMWVMHNKLKHVDMIEALKSND